MQAWLVWLLTIYPDAQWEQTLKKRLKYPCLEHRRFLIAQERMSCWMAFKERMTTPLFVHVSWLDMMFAPEQVCRGIGR